MNGYFPVQSYFSTKFSTKMQKNYTQKIAENSSPTGGGIWPRFRKNFEKLFLQITMGEIKKAPQTKFFVVGAIFTPKIAQKCKKWPTENPHPRSGGYRKSPPPPGGFIPFWLTRLSLSITSMLPGRFKHGARTRVGLGTEFWYLGIFWTPNFDTWSNA